ncbi:uncharacterized protein EDB91DRAFT_1243547 [Suillus paluster]|uniref:uncharacterized protein n=1 Tax=Suillus paluster TaxID=48578 RepID=UPI001B86AB2D|nr:uncharacterized protein EDB91DRAFT_1243547 [Suillus paluster]KAG1751277.1 hypothetical protein EDB91DRAFT_1243547 [Suillus paluster]
MAIPKLDSSPSIYQQSISRTPSSTSTTSSRLCDNTTPTKRIPSSGTHSPRSRVCTPNKLTPSAHSQPTLAMSIVAPTPRTPQPQGTSSRLQSPRSPPPRSSSRSERLLRDTLRKDNTLRTTVTSRARSRSRSTCSDCDDDEFFQPILLFQSSRRNSGASARNVQSKTFYVPNENEDSSYAQLLRSSSDSDSKGYPISSIQQEKLDESLSTSLPRPYVLSSETAPHEAVLKSRLERVLQRGMREEERRIKRSPDDESSSASPPSSARSLSNSFSNSHSSEKSHVTAPEVEIPPSLSSNRGRAHRNSQSTSVTYVQKSPRSPRSQGETSPWMTTPLPPSPPFSTPSKKSPSSPYTTPSPHSQHPAMLSTFSSVNSKIPVNQPQFDLRAASQACKQVSGYVSFASVAGLGAPPGVGDDEASIKEPRRGRGRGRWWVF